MIQYGSGYLTVTVTRSRTDTHFHGQDLLEAIYKTLEDSRNPNNYWKSQKSSFLMGPATKREGPDH